MNVKQIRYVTAATPAALQLAVNECFNQDNRWDVVGPVNVYDKPDVAEDRVWVQTIIRYISQDELLLEERSDMPQL